MPSDPAPVTAAEVGPLASVRYTDEDGDVLEVERSGRITAHGSDGDYRAVDIPESLAAKIIALIARDGWS